MSYQQLDAHELRRRIDTGELTAEALVRSCLRRIEAREQTVNAWEYLDPGQVLQQAQALDAGPSRGPLHGLPVGVKDLFDTCDMPTGYGSDIYRGHRPAWDAAAVAALRMAGAVIAGKTVTTEFATFQPGRTANPHAPAHTPGGSSSGSAAAVADGMIPLALGTQTAGSIIRPAAYCGVVGYKPSFGLIQRAGLKSLADSLDTIGVFTRTVTDAALLTAVLSGRPELEAITAVTTPPRVGLCRMPGWSAAEPAMVQALDRAAERFRLAGATPDEAGLPAAFTDLDAAQADIMGFEIARSLAFERHRHGDRLSARLSELIAAGLAVTAERYDEAQSLARYSRAALDDLFRDRDVLLVPSATGEAPRGLGATGDPVFCRMWTLLHLPCINLPGLLGPAGLPVGVQLIGRPGRDADLLRVAAWAEPILADQPET